MLPRRFIALLGAVLMFVTGCGGQARDTETQVEVQHQEVVEVTETAPNSTSSAPTTSQVESKEVEQAARAKPPKQAFPEIQFRPVVWMGGAPVTTNESGIWVYTKEQHPADANLPWDKNDLLLLRLPLDQFTGYELKVLALQKIGEDVIRIVTRVTPPRPNIATDKERRPVAWLTVDRGALSNMRFVVVDEAFQELEVHY